MEFHQLVRTWLVCASCQMPVISKSFELQIQVGGGKGSNKVRVLTFILQISKTRRSCEDVHLLLLHASDLLDSTVV